jgi:hypothetical protein
VLAGWASLAPLAGLEAAEPGHRLLLVREDDLRETRVRLAAREATVLDALERLQRRAEMALAFEPVSVLMKTSAPPSGDRRDYVSLAPYWWPDPSKPSGRPYVRRDGERNPEADSDGYDDRRFSRLRGAVSDLALAHALTGDERYAQHAARLMRAWFVDPATAMNPHLNHAQMVPGLDQGRSFGIIETARMAEFLDRVTLLERSGAWTASDRSAFEVWMRAYFDWLRTSLHGRREAEAPNNHGTWYDAQLAALALWLGEEATARSRLDVSTRARIAAQIEPDGRQPRELARTRSLSYSVFNLAAFFTAARLGEHLGVRLWDHETPDGRSIRQALDYLVPVTVPPWHWHAGPQIAAPPWSGLARLLRIGARQYGDPRYAAALERLPADPPPDAEGVLLHPPRRP